MIKMIEVTEDEYKHMNERILFLDALHAAGVDNWSGYEFAQETFYEWLEGEYLGD